MPILAILCVCVEVILVELGDLVLDVGAKFEFKEEINFKFYFDIALRAQSIAAFCLSGDISEFL